MKNHFIFLRSRYLSLGLLSLTLTDVGLAQELKPLESAKSANAKTADGSTDPKQAIMQGALDALAAGDIELAREKLEPLATQKDTFHEEAALAQLLFARKLNAEGKKVLEKLAVQEPKRLDVYVMFCEVAVNEQRWFDGWNLINLAERLTTPENWSASYRRRIGNRLEILKARCLEGREGWEQAKEIYTKLEKTEEDGPEVWIGHARCEFRLKNYDQSIAYFSKVKQKNPEIAPPELMLAKQFESDLEPKQAEKYFRAAVASPKNSERDRKKSALELARFLIFNNRPNEAMDMVKTPFLASNSTTTEPKSEGTENSKEVDEPLERERLFLTGVVARIQQRFLDAQTIFSKLHQQESLSFPIGNHLALCLVESDQEVLRARALQIAEVNVRNNANIQDAWGTLGFIQFRLGDLASAEKSLAKAVQSGQLNRDTAVILAMIKKSMGDDSTAKQLREQSAKLPGPVFYPE